MTELPVRRLKLKVITCDKNHLIVANQLYRNINLAHYQTQLSGDGGVLGVLHSPTSLVGKNG